MIKKGCFNPLNTVLCFSFAAIVYNLTENSVNGSVRKVPNQDRFYDAQSVHVKSSEGVRLQSILQSYDYEDGSEPLPYKGDDNKSYDYKSYETAESSTESLSESYDNYVVLPHNQMHANFDLEKWMSYLNDTHDPHEPSKAPTDLANTSEPGSMNKPAALARVHKNRAAKDTKKLAKNTEIGVTDRDWSNSTNSTQSQKPRHMHLHLHLHVSEGQLLARVKRSTLVKAWSPLLTKNKPNLSMAWQKYLPKYIQNTLQNESTSLPFAKYGDLSFANDEISSNENNEDLANANDVNDANSESAKDDIYIIPNDDRSASSIDDNSVSPKDVNSSASSKDMLSPVDHILSSFKYLTPLIQKFVNKSPSLTFNVHVDKQLKSNTLTMTPTDKVNMVDFDYNRNRSEEKVVQIDEKSTSSQENLFSVIFRNIPTVVAKPANLSNDVIWARTQGFGRGQSVWGHYVDSLNLTFI